MSYLPQSTILGKLQPLEVYEYYDRPSLFACNNLSGQIFIALWVDSKESEDVWLYAPVSATRFQHIRKGRIELREVFQKSEDGLVFQVIVARENLTTKVQAIPGEELEEDYLPEAGETINTQERIVPN